MKLEIHQSQFILDGIPTKIGNDKELNDNYGVFDGQEQIIKTDDYITDIKNDSERVLYKSFKGATILIDDKDGKETIKIIDQAGQQIIMENNGDSLPRRKSNTNPPASASIKIISNGNVCIDSDTFEVKSRKNYIDIYDSDVKLNR